MKLDSLHRESPTQQVVIAAGWDEITVARAAMAPFLASLKGSDSGELVVAWGDARLAKAHQALLGLIRRDLDQSTITSTSPAPIPFAGWITSARSRDPWAAVDVDALSDRLRTAWIRRELVDVAAIIAVNRIPTGTSRDPLVLGLWAKFAHPRQRLGALASDERTGLRAELATAINPALCLLIGESRERPLIVATPDQVAAELVGRALQFLSHPDPTGERVSAWELPLVQRATELELGVRLPSELTIQAVWAGKSGEPGERTFLATVDQVRLSLGVPAL